MTGVLIERENPDKETDTYRGKMMHTDTRRRWPSVSRGQRPGTDAPFVAHRRDPANTLILDFWPPDGEKTKFCSKF